MLSHSPCVICGAGAWHGDGEQLAGMTVLLYLFEGAMGLPVFIVVAVCLTLGTNRGLSHWFNRRHAVCIKWIKAWTKCLAGEFGDGGWYGIVIYPRRALAGLFV